MTATEPVMEGHQCSLCDAFPYPTAEDLADHVTIDHGDSRPELRPVPTNVARTPAVVPGRRFETVDNGFGGTTTRRVYVPAPPTERQVAYLRTLLAERAGIAAAEAIRDRLNERRVAGELSKVVVSEAIDRLLEIRRPRTEEGTPQRFDRPTSLPDVPAGHYAIPSNGENDLSFYRVDRPTEGPYAGRTFVKVVIGGRPDENVPYRQMPGILARIVEAGIAEAGATYGRAIGRCCRCNRHLTDKTSRALGIGPECRTK
jgi:hypothetical protein